MDGKLPINDNDCEEIVLGSIISNKNAYGEVGEIFDEDCFYSQRDKDIYRSIKKIIDRGEEPDVIMVKAELEKTPTKITPYEPNHGNTLMKFETMNTWCTAGRLVTWYKNSFKYGR